MSIILEKGSRKHLDDCEEALVNSALGEAYFSEKGSARQAILEGIRRGTLYAALVDAVCVGFFYYIPKGAFHSFPYLHLIAIKADYRGRGIGTEMLDLLENIAFEEANKLFLVAADFNLDAKRFYERNGYRQIGVIPDLYRAGMNEYLMMKEKDIHEG